MKRDNKGFSLVELIIVIAIMAILVGVMAPALLKYVEKSRVTSDQELLNAIYTAVVYASGDISVLEDPVSRTFIDVTMKNPTSLSAIPTTSALYREILGTLNWPDLTPATYMQYVESAHTASSDIMFMYKGGVMNPIAMWITESDFTGGKDTSENASNYTAIVKNISIK